MLRPSVSSLIALTFALNLQAETPGPPVQLDLKGIVRPDNVGASVLQLKHLQLTLSGVERSFLQSTQPNSKGEFRFRSLEPGNYTLSVSHPILGEIRRTIVISRDLADHQGIVRTNIVYSESEAAGSHAGTVSMAQLTIPPEATEKYNAAQHHLAERDFAGAIAKLKQAVALAPRFSAAWNSLGVIAIQAPSEPGQNSQLQAEEYFRYGVKADPQAFDPLVNLGGVLLKSDRADEALSYNQRAAEVRPKDPLANAQLGMNYYKLGELDSAEHYLITAKQLDPAQYSLPQLFLAEIYTRRGNRPAALVELEQLVKQRPDDPILGAVRVAIARLRDE